MSTTRNPNHAALLAEKISLIAERDAEIVRLNLQVSELQGAASNSRSSLCSHTRATLSGMRQTLTKVLGAFNKAHPQFCKAAQAAGVVGPVNVAGIDACTKLIVEAVIPLVDAD